MGWTVHGDTSWSEEEPVYPVVQLHQAVAVKTIPLLFIADDAECRRQQIGHQKISRADE